MLKLNEDLIAAELVDEDSMLAKMVEDLKEAELVEDARAAELIDED